jgi:RNA polymerase sigma-70 factor (ECF subfamily)
MSLALAYRPAVVAVRREPAHRLFGPSIDCTRDGGYRDAKVREAGPVTDGALIRRVAGGDREALGTLYDRYAGILVAVARRIVGDAREAEDLVHDVVLEVWRSAGDYDDARGSVRAWILMRLRSRALDRRKAPRVARQVAMTPEAMEGALSEEAEAHWAPDRSRVRQALAQLPPEQRTVLELGYYEGLSSTEIALRVAVPVGTVKSRVAAALAKLRAGLDISYRGGGS